MTMRLMVVLPAWPIRMSYLFAAAFREHLVTEVPFGISLLLGYLEKKRTGLIHLNSGRCMYTIHSLNVT